MQAPLKRKAPPMHGTKTKARGSAPTATAVAPFEHVADVNRCVNCGMNLGQSNPRQYCCKTHCPHPTGEFFSPEALLDDSEYVEDWLSESEADALLQFCKDQDYDFIPFRGTVLKRAPKIMRWSGEEPRLYKFGQERRGWDLGESMGLELLRLQQKIVEDFGVETNHAIVIKYGSGTEHHAPAHKDKLPADTSFFVISVGDPRQFIISKDREVKTIVWDKKLAHGSMLVVGPTTNEKYFHSVPKDKAHKGLRFSVIFRTMPLFTAEDLEKMQDAKELYIAKKQGSSLEFPIVLE
jgi:alkylated DNA repair dioxygenase AlkB